MVDLRHVSELKLLLVLLDRRYQRMVGSHKAEAAGGDLVDALLAKILSGVF